MTRLTAVLGALTLAVTLPTTTLAYLGTDDSGEYAYSDSLHPEDPDSPPHGFTSLGTSGEAGPIGDDQVMEAPIGFDFEFYGEVYDTVLISTNGFISFDLDADDGCCDGGSIPSADLVDDVVAACWSDLSTTGGSIRYETRGTAPSRELVVEWNNVDYLGTGGPATFQIVLTEGADEIAIHIDADGDGSDTTTIGIENAAGTDGIEYFQGMTSSIDLDDTTIVFVPMRDAPRLAVVTDPLSIPEGGTLELEVTATDRQGDPVTIEWDTDLDGEYDDGTGETVAVSAEGLDGPGSAVRIGVRASDPDDNRDARVIEIPVRNAPPEFTSTPESTEILINHEWSYTPTVVDPGGDDFDVEVIARPDGMVLLSGGGVRWSRPGVADVGEHTLTFRATDEDDNPTVEGDGDALQQLVITVRENSAPAQPVILSPRRNETVSTARPTIVVQNPADPEGDPIEIHLEVDVSDSYPDPIAGAVPVGAEETSEWTLTQDLEDGRRYYVRVWASDGAAESTRASTSFTVDLAGDGGPTDGGPDGGGDGEVRADAGCNCGAVGRGPATASLLAIALLLGAFLLARRA